MIFKSYYNVFSFILISLFLIPSSSYAFSGSCAKTQTFKIGKIDKEFNLTKEDALAYALEAAKIWNDGLGERVLEYSENGKVIINFKYDKRQKEAVEKNILSEKKKLKAVVIDSKLKDLNTEKDKLDNLQNDFKTDWDNFKNKLDNYNASVTKANQAGGADAYSYNVLNEDKYKLEKERLELEDRDKNIASFLGILNVKIKDYNDLVAEANILVKELNKNVGKQFEQGSFSNNKITLYEYESVINLKRLLAHELGHALKMRHAKNSESIMHYINTSEKFVLTKEDIVEYYRVCGGR